MVRLLWSETVAWVPGAYELPFAVKKLLAWGRFDAVVALGVVIKGATPHAEYINAFISERIGSHVPMALRVVVEIASNPEEKGGIRLKAAQDILDRGGFGAKQKLELTTKNVEDMSAEDLISEVRRILDEEPELAKVISFPTS